MLPTCLALFLPPYNYLRTTMNGTYATISLVSGETIGNAYLNIFSLLVRSHNLYNKVGNVCRNGFLGDVLDECAKLHWQTFFALQMSRKSVIRTHTQARQQLPRTFFFPTNELQSMLTPWLTMEMSSLCSFWNHLMISLRVGLFSNTKRSHNVHSVVPYLFFWAVIGSEKPKNGSARFTNPFL